MAEEIIQPQPPPPNAPKYFYPGFYYYTPEPYQTTHIPKHHHHHHLLPPPLKHAVHDLAHPFGDSYPLPAPHSDVRETKAAYHIDVELPGCADHGLLRLKWTGARTLFLDATVPRPPLPEEGGGNKKKTGQVHFLKRERRTGEFARAFSFPVDVDQDGTVARLAHGVLTVVVPKKEREEEEEEEHKTVEIDHAGH